MSANPFDEFYQKDDSAQSNGGNPFSEFYEAPVKIAKPVLAPKNSKGMVNDTLVGLGKGVMMLPGAVTGLADIPAGLAGLDRPFSRAADVAGEATGFQPAQWAEESDKDYSPAMQASRRAIDAVWNDPNTDGFDVAKAYIDNPRASFGTVVESLPSMYAGNALGRVATGMKSLAPGASKAEVLKRATLASGVGEGGIMAGQAMENIDKSVDPQKAALASAAIGVGGGLIGTQSGRLASKLGFADVDTAIASAGRAGLAPVNAAGDVVQPMWKRVLGGALQEGPIEEGSQSLLETGMQNLAEDKPVTQGMARNFVEGSIAGVAMGAPVGVFSGPLSRAAGQAPAASTAAVDQIAASEEADQARVLAETEAQIRAEQAAVRDTQMPGAGTVLPGSSTLMGDNGVIRAPETNPFNEFYEDSQDERQDEPQTTLVPDNTARGDAETTLEDGAGLVLGGDNGAADSQAVTSERKVVEPVLDAKQQARKEKEYTATENYLKSGPQTEKISEAMKANAKRMGVSIDASVDRPIDVIVKIGTAFEQLKAQKQPLAPEAENDNVLPLDDTTLRLRSGQALDAPDQVVDAADAVLAGQERAPGQSDDGAIGEDVATSADAVDAVDAGLREEATQPTLDAGEIPVTQNELLDASTPVPVSEAERLSASPGAALQRTVNESLTVADQDRQGSALNYWKNERNAYLDHKKEVADSITGKKDKKNFEGFARSAEDTFKPENIRGFRKNQVVEVKSDTADKVDLYAYSDSSKQFYKLADSAIPAKDSLLDQRLQNAVTQDAQSEPEPQPTFKELTDETNESTNEENALRLRSGQAQDAREEKETLLGENTKIEDVGPREDAAQSTATSQAVARYQWQRNKEGGQAFGNKQEIFRLDEPLFNEHVKGKVAAASFDEYSKKYPDQYVSLVSKADGNKVFDRIGGLDEVTPNEAKIKKGWVKPVEAFDIEDAILHGKSADSEPSETPVAPPTNDASKPQVADTESQSAAEIADPQSALRTYTGAEPLDTIGKDLGFEDKYLAFYQLNKLAAIMGYKNTKQLTNFNASKNGRIELRDAVSFINSKMPKYKAPVSPVSKLQENISDELDDISKDASNLKISGLRSDLQKLYSINSELPTYYDKDTKSERFDLHDWDLVVSQLVHYAKPGLDASLKSRYSNEKNADTKAVIARIIRARAKVKKGAVTTKPVKQTDVNVGLREDAAQPTKAEKIDHTETKQIRKDLDAAIQRMSKRAETSETAQKGRDNLIAIAKNMDKGLSYGEAFYEVHGETTSEAFRSLMSDVGKGIAGSHTTHKNGSLGDITPKKYAPETETGRRIAAIIKEEITKAKRPAEIKSPIDKGAQESEHAGYKIYPSTVGGKDYFAVQSQENKELANGKVFGDSLHATLEGAKKQADLNARKDAERVRYDEEVKATEEKERVAKTEKEDIDGFGEQLTAMQKGKVVATLNKNIRINDKTDSLKSQVKRLLADGEKPNTNEENRIKDKPRREWNNMDGRQQAEHERKVREGGKVTKYNIGGFDLGRTAYDYANHLLAQQDVRAQETTSDEEYRYYPDDADAVTDKHIEAMIKRGLLKKPGNQNIDAQELEYEINEIKSAFQTEADEFIADYAKRDKRNSKNVEVIWKQYKDLRRDMPEVTKEYFYDIFYNRYEDLKPGENVSAPSVQAKDVDVGLRKAATQPTGAEQPANPGYMLKLKHQNLFERGMKEGAVAKPLGLTRGAGLTAIDNGAKTIQEQKVFEKGFELGANYLEEYRNNDNLIKSAIEKGDVNPVDFEMHYDGFQTYAREKGIVDNPQAKRVEGSKPVIHIPIEEYKKGLANEQEKSEAANSESQLNKEPAISKGQEANSGTESSNGQAKVTAKTIIDEISNYADKWQKKYQEVISDAEPTIGKDNRLHAPHDGYAWMDGRVYAGGQYLPDEDGGSRQKQYKAAIVVTPEVAKRIVDAIGNSQFIEAKPSKIFNKDGEDRQFLNLYGARGLIDKIHELVPGSDEHSQLNRRMITVAEAETKGIKLGKTWKYSYKRELLKSESYGIDWTEGKPSYDKQMVGYYYPDYTVREIGETETALEKANKLIASQPNNTLVSTSIEDWGTGRGQGKRSGNMVMGAMSAAHKGKKTYVDSLGQLQEAEPASYEEAKLLEAYQKLDYSRARSAGFSHDQAMNYVYRSDIKGGDWLNHKTGQFSKTQPALAVSEAELNPYTDVKEATNHLIKDFGPGVKTLINTGMLNFTKGKEAWPEAAKTEGYQDAEAVYVNGKPFDSLRPRSGQDAQGKAFIDLNATDRSRLSGVLLHEIGEHYQLKRVLGTKSYYDLQRQIANLAKQKGSVEEKIWNQVANLYQNTEVGSETFISEVIAKLGEANPELPWYKRLISQIKAFLMQHGLARGFITNRLTGADMHALLVASLQSAINASTSLSTSARFYNSAMASVPAWHGGPHDHNKFDSSKIGTGEGAQAFGYGHYFAGAKNIAEYYRDKLSKRASTTSKDITVDGVTLYDLASKSVRPIVRSKTVVALINASNFSIDEAISNLESDTTIQDRPEFIAEGSVFLNSLRGKEIKENPQNEGKLYQVELAPDIDELLDWDKPLSEQSDKVKAQIPRIEKALGSAYMRELEYKLNIDVSELTGSELYKGVSRYAGESALPGQEDTSGNYDKDASDYLHSLGIRGVQYKAEGGKSTARNYVIFDDKDIDIKAKFSVPAWHGSGADFDRFENSKIGTGFGKELHGRGHYFASLRQAAEYYKGIAARPRFYLQGKNGVRLDKNDLQNVFINGKTDRDLTALQKEFFDALSNNNQDVAEFATVHPNSKYQDVIDYWKDNGDKFIRTGKPGKLYQVDLKPDEYQFLDWNKPLSQQPDYVNKALYGNLPWAITNPSTSLRASPDVMSTTGEDVYKAYAKQLGSTQAASDYLSSLGIHGNKFQTSKSDASSNFVMFDPAEIDIKAKFSIASANKSGDTEVMNKKAVVVDEGLLNLAVEETKASSHRFTMENDSQGVIPGNVRQLDKEIARSETNTGNISKEWAKTRDYIRNRYGDEVVLYRVSPPESERNDSTQTLYYGDRKLAKKFETKTQKAIPYIIKVEDILALYARPSGYYEFIVRKTDDAGIKAKFSIADKKTKDPTVYWHGSPSGDYRGGSTGLHLGTKKAAKQALEARIGVPATGEWDGTREYGKTKLMGMNKMRRLEKEEKRYLITGQNAGAPAEDYYPTKVLKYADGTDMPMTVKPNIQGFRLDTEMSNNRANPHEDFKANGYMRASIKKGNAKRGYYYKNEGEDEGSISVVVPNGQHIKLIGDESKAKFSIAAQNQQIDTDAAWTPQRIGGMFREYANPDGKRTEAFAAYVNPTDFLKATTSSTNSLANIESETKALDIDRMAGLDQPITLYGELQDGVFKTADHEGRHRISALRNAGIERVPVVFKLNKPMAMGELPAVHVTGQHNLNGEGKGIEQGKPFEITDAIPFNYQSSNALKAQFKGGEGRVQFSRSAPFDSAQGERLTASGMVSSARKSDIGKSVGDVVDARLEDLRTNQYAFLTQRQLVDRAKEGFTAAVKYLQERTLMDKTGEMIKQASDTIAKKWEHLVPHSDMPFADKTRKAQNRAMQKKLADTFHFATIYGQDPRVPYSGKADDVTNRANYNYVRKLYDNLGKDSIAQQVFSEVVDDHKARLARIIKAEKANVEATTASREAKDAMIAELDRILLESKIYVPLSRFGNYGLQYTKGGEKGFIMRDTQRQIDRFIEDNPGIEIISNTLKLGSMNKLSGVSHDFLDGVHKLTEGIKDTGEKEKFQDAMFQLYLKSLPDMSARKHFIHRNKTPGYEEDALRSYASKAFHDAKAIGRLEHRLTLEGYLRSMNNAVDAAANTEKMRSLEAKLELLRALPKDSQTPEGREQELYELHEEYDRREPKAEAQAKLIARETANLEEVKAMADKIGADSHRYVRILSELQASHDAMMNPNVASWASFANSVGFGYFIGFSASSALVNGLQTPNVALPYMAARHGMAKSAAALIRAAKLYYKKPDADGHFTMRASLTGVKAEAFDEFMAKGDITKTQAMDLIGIAEEGVEAGSMRRKLMYVMGYMFNAVEIFNRELTAMAAFELEYEANKNLPDKERKEKSIFYASELTSTAHGDYNPANRARIMRGNVARVLTQFKQYPQFMTYNWAKAGMEAIGVANKKRKGIPLTVEDKEAAKLLGFMVMTQGAMAGAMGLPIGGILVALQMIASAVDDDDDPINVEDMMKSLIYNYLPSAFDINDAVARGPFTAWLGADVQSRLSLKDVFVQEPQKSLEGKYGTQYLAETLGGPIGGIVQNGFDFLKMWNDDYKGRAVEKLLPKAFRDPLTALRIYREGVTNLRGDVISEINEFQALAKLVGFTDSDTSMTYDVNFTKARVEAEFKKRKAHLIDLAARARINNDPQAFKEAWLQINNGWNKTNPEVKITMPMINRSVKQRKATSKRMENGFLIDKKLLSKTDRYNYDDG